MSVKKQQNNSTQIVDSQIVDKLREDSWTSKALLNANDDIAILIDAKGYIIIEINETALNLFGENRKDIIGENALAYIPDNSQIIWKNNLQECVIRATPIKFRDERNGSHFIIRFIPVKDNAGKVVQIAIYATDLTEQLQEKEKLYFSEQKFLKMFMAIPEACSVTLLKTGEYIEVNEEFLKISGFDREDLIGETSADINLWVNQEARKRYFNELKIHGRVKDFETLFMMKSGKIRKFLISSEIVDINEDQYSINFIHDITARKQYEEDLKESEERYRVFIDSTDDMAFLKDEKFRYILVNHSNADFFGKPESEIIGKTDFELMPMELAQQCFESDKKVICSDEIFVSEERTGNHDYEVHKFKVPLKGGHTGVGGYIRDITQRKKNEEELFEYSQRLKLATASGQLGVWDWDVKADIMFWDDRMLELYGITRDVFSNKVEAWTEGVHPDDRQRTIEECNASLAGEREFNTTFRVLHPDGNVLHIRAHGIVIRDTDGKPARMIGINRNITESALAAELLQKSKERWESLFNNSPDSIAVYQAVDNGNDFIFNDFNQTAERTDKLNRENVIGKRISELFPSAEELGFLDVFRRVWKTGRTEYMNTTNYKDNRIDGWRENIIYKLNTGEIVAIYNDVTQRKRAEMELIAAKEKAEENAQSLKEQKEEIEFNNERLESLLLIAQYQTSSIQDLLDYALEEAIKLTRSKIGYIYFYNETTRQFQLNTWSHDVMKECSVANPSGIYDLDKTGCWGEAVRQRKPIIINDYQADNPLKKGTPEGHVNLIKFLTIPVIVDNIIVAVAGVANKAKDYNISDVRQLTLLMDNIWKIVERITLTENLKIAKEKAEESDRLKTAFLQNMSHEIRTPLNAIMGFSSMLSANFDNKEKLAFFSGIIEKRGNDLLEIIDGILDIARIESGQLALNLDKCILSAIFTEIGVLFSEYQNRINKNNIHFVISQSCLDLKITVIIDQVKLKQIFINLINNAFKFTNEGKIEVGCKYSGKNKIVFYVSDTGIGIPKDKHADIFVRFKQASKEISQHYGGTGIGLSIVQGLINLMKGSIWMESEPGKGSTFYFSLPINIVKDENDQASEIVEEIPMYKGNATILIVEDDTYNSDYLREILSYPNFTILITEFGFRAVEIVMSQKIDIVLMDIRLPDIQGYEAIKIIKEQKPNLTIITQTAYATSADRLRAMEAGSDDYISKPVNREMLLSKINKFLIAKKSH